MGHCISTWHILHFHKSLEASSIQPPEHTRKKTSTSEVQRKENGRKKSATNTIVEDCSNCQQKSVEPCRFNLNIFTADMRFNNEVHVDTMSITSKIVFHVVEVATHFTIEKFIKNQTSGEVWKAIRRTWTLLYWGPPDFFYLDQGSNYMSSLFQTGAIYYEVTILEAKARPLFPLELWNDITLV